MGHKSSDNVMCVLKMIAILHTF